MDDSLLSRAFEVEKLPDNFDPTVPPSTGQEYLQHVMYEASKCPQVVVADIDRKKLKNNVNLQLEVDSLVTDSELTPSIEWQQQQIAIFSNLRRKIESCKKSNKFRAVDLPKAHFEEKWYDICIGDENLRAEPSLTFLLSMNEFLLGRILEYHAEWLKDGLKTNQGKWIYALLACLALPLTSETCSAVRDLARQCAKIRCMKASLEFPPSLGDSDIIALNLIICLVKKYFGQADLFN